MSPPDLAPSPTDADLARRALDGEREAFTLLASRHKSWLFRFIRRYVGDDHDAVDLLQETLVSTWQALHRYDTSRAFPAWVRQIALNKCRDWSRRRVLRRIVDHVAGDLDLFAAPLAQSDPAVMAGADETLRRLDRAISALPLGLREPFILTAFEGLSQRETAQQLGLSEKAVEMRVYRARQRIAGQVEKTDLQLLAGHASP